MENRLNEEGFIMQYLISGLREEPFIDHTADENQLRYEKYLQIDSYQTSDKGAAGSG